MKIRGLFQKGNVGLGWALLWRVSLILVPLNLMARFAAEDAVANPAAGVLMLLALPIGGNLYLVPLAIPAVLLSLNVIGKHVLRTRLGYTTPRFIGWSLYWRIALLQLAGLIPLGAATALLAFLANASGEGARTAIMALAALTMVPALVYWSLNVNGLALKRVAALVPAQAEPALAGAASGSILVRDYRVLFDRARFGTNWLLAAAYLVSGFASTLIYPAVQALLGAGWIGYGMGDSLPVYIGSWALAGAGLTLALHHCRSGWQVVLAFTILMVALRFFESGLLSTAGAGPGLSLLEPRYLAARAVFGALFSAGLLLGIRYLGPGVPGIALGTGLAQLVHSLFAYPLLARLMPIDGDVNIWDLARMAEDTLATTIDAAATGALLWWACDWHLKRHGRRLTQRGVIQPIEASGSPTGIMRNRQ